MIKKYKKIGVIGAGAWGTAIATLLIKAKPWGEVLLYTNDTTIMNSINTHSVNPIFPDSPLSPNIHCTINMQEMVECADVFIAVPTSALRQVISQFIDICSKSKRDFKKDYIGVKLQHDTIRELPGLILCCKGIENTVTSTNGSNQQTIMLPLEIISSCGWNGITAVLSGPNFASEVMQNLPTTATVSTVYKSYGPMLRLLLENQDFSLKVDTHTISTQIYGALKNVVAIGSGLIEGLGLGENAKAAFFAAAVAEIGKVVIAAKGKINSILTPAGIGDMFLTCSSKKSRNFSFGYKIGLSQIDQEVDFGQIIEEAERMTVEGYRTVKLVEAIEQRFGVKMPISRMLSRIIKQEVKPNHIVHCL